MWPAEWLFEILKGAVFEWNEDKVPRMAAAIAFYAVFSLTPIVVIAFKLAELTFGPDVALREILTQAAFLIGTEGADGIKLLIENAEPHTASTTSTLVGLAAMIFAATGVFTELKDSLNTIWEVQPRPGLGILEMIRYRFFAFGMVLVIWFLMLVSLLASAALSAVSQYASSYLVGVQLGESFLSLTLITLLFALIYRILPDVSVAWRDVWFGANHSHLFCRRKVAVRPLSRTQLHRHQLRSGRVTRYRHSLDILFLPDLAVRSGDNPGPGWTSPRQARAKRNRRSCHGTCSRPAGHTPH